MDYLMPDPEAEKQIRDNYLRQGREKCDALYPLIKKGTFKHLGIKCHVPPDRQKYICMCCFQRHPNSGFGTINSSCAENKFQIVISSKSYFCQ